MHELQRIRHELKRRNLTVASVSPLTPKMRRIVLTSPELADFESFGADDHIKLFVPDPAASQGLVGRDYTPRAFDRARRELTIDFALHDAGPATAWALAAKPGDGLQIGGPRGSLVVPDDFDFYLLIGDETALPAIGRRVEELRADAPVFTFILIDDPNDRQTFETRADWRPVWIYRDGLDEAETIKQSLETFTAPAGDGYAWVGAEARTARGIKNYLIEERAHPKAWLKASGYWVRGKPGESEKVSE